MQILIDERIWSGYCQRILSQVTESRKKEVKKLLKETHRLLEKMTETDDSSVLQKSMDAFKMHLSVNARTFGVSATPSNFFIRKEN